MTTRPNAGETLGQYRLLELIGEGGVGVVFRAEGEDGNEVALKILKEELARDETIRHRFAREALAAQAIVHKHLVPVIDAGEVDGLCYLAAQYCADGSLADRIRTRGPLSVPETLRVAAGVASALGVLHDRGIIHRDVKPTNVLLDGGEALLTDLGVLRGKDFSSVTRSGHLIGTSLYLAPELIEGKEATPASDTYALGCTIFECLTGKPPFSGRSVFEVAMAHLGEEPPDACDLRSDLRASIASVLRYALEKAPGDRPPSAIAYATMLGVAARGLNEGDAGF